MNAVSRKYISWYRIIESVFGLDVPHLTDTKIQSYVSSEDWMIIPITGEQNKEDARQAQRPNLFFELSQDKAIRVGITYDKIESVQRLRQVIMPFNSKTREEMLERLAVLDDSFFTNVSRKMKEYYWAQSPLYRIVYRRQCNALTQPDLIEMFTTVDKIMAERDLLEKGKKYKLAPAINLVDVTTLRDEVHFREILKKIKPVYEAAVNVETEEDVEVAKAEVESQKRDDFAKYVEDLKQKLSQKSITPEQYRELTMKYWKQ